MSLAIDGFPTRLGGFVASKDATGVSLRFDLTENDAEAVRKFATTRKAA
jgi:hypothetical protein